jgi:hypothetical protein
MQRAPMHAYTYPHTIENGAGERITFIRRVAGRAGERLQVGSTRTCSSWRTSTEWSTTRPHARRSAREPCNETLKLGLEDVRAAQRAVGCLD